METTTTTSIQSSTGPSHLARTIAVAVGALMAAGLALVGTGGPATARPAGGTSAAAASAYVARVQSRQPEFVCAQAHLQNIGWHVIRCGRFVEVGTTGQSRRLEALRIWASPGTGRVCARAHVQNIGWMRQDCDAAGPGFLQVGTTGRSLRLEAVRLRVARTAFCAQAHVQDVGWMGPRCTWRPWRQVEVGTTGRSLRLEALRLLLR